MLLISLANTVFLMLHIHLRVACINSSDVKGPTCHDKLGCLVLHVKGHKCAVTDSNLLSLLNLVISMRCWISPGGLVVSASGVSTGGISTSLSNSV